MRTIKVFILLLGVSVALSACNLKFIKRKPPEVPLKVEQCDPAAGPCIEVQTPDENTLRPKNRATQAEVPKGFVEGVNAEILDSSTQKEKKNALKTNASGADSKKIGHTVASLGAVAEQGFWLKTPLVIVETKGRIVWASNGNSVNVTLIPKQGEATSGSQISLAAMRALEVPLTALPELIVFAQ